jgi:PAS domain S-box-containing protein
MTTDQNKLKRKLLIIEAEELMRKYISSCIIPTGMFDLLESPGLNDARKQIILNKPQVIVYDLMISPDLTANMVRWLRTYFDDYYPYLIALSAYKDDRLTQLAYNSGADYFLEKNFSRFELAGILNNIVRQLDFRQQVREKEFHYRTIFEMAGDSLLLVSLNTKIVKNANPAASKMFGYELGEMIGLKLDFFLEVPEKAQDLMNKKLSFVSGMGLIKKDGTVFSAMAGFAYFPDQQLALISIRDLTEQLRQQKEKNALLLIQQSDDEEVSYKETLAFLTGEENERRRISQEIHDHIGQLMVSVKLQIENVLDTFTGEEDRNKVVPIRNQVVEAIASLRKISTEMAVDFLPGNNLSDAIQTLVDNIRHKSKIQITDSIGAVPEHFSTFFQSNIYRIVEESFTNALKHGGKSNVHFELFCDADFLFMKLENQGRSKKPILGHGGMGLRIMQQRAVLIGGTLQFEALVNGSFTVMLKVPLEKEKKY